MFLRGLEGFLLGGRQLYLRTGRLLWLDERDEFERVPALAYLGAKSIELAASGESDAQLPTISSGSCVQGRRQRIRPSVTALFGWLAD